MVVNFRKMVIISKLIISTFSVGIPKFPLKNSFAIDVHQNAVIKLHKSGKSNVENVKGLEMNRSTVWKIAKKFQVTGNTLGRPENGVFAPLNSSKTREKSCNETLADAAEPWPPKPV